MTESYIDSRQRGKEEDQWKSVDDQLNQLKYVINSAIVKHAHQTVHWANT